VSAPIEVELSTLAEKDWVFVASHLPVPLMERSRARTRRNAALLGVSKISLPASENSSLE